MSNVRFYRLGALPSFDNTKHVGIFVHATGTTAGSDTYLMGTGVSFNKWLTDNHYTQIPSGLWFGGENGWELLSNDTTSGAIDAAIDAKIQDLDVTGYAQAVMSTIDNETGKSSTLTIYGIKEDDGKIGKYATSNFDVAIDGVYDKLSNKIATKDTVTNAINGLNVEGPIQAVTFNTSEKGNTTLTFNGVKEENGLIAQGASEGAGTFVVGDAKLQIKIGSTDAFEVFSANAQENKVIQLNGDVFKKNGDVISVITKNNDVSSTNPLVTQKDIDSLAGAMHYKGSVSSLADFEKIINNTDSDSDAEEAGNVYIATGNFTHDNNVISTGDMIVFNGASNYNVIQSNITLGTGVGQVAANDGNLTPNYMVIATENGIKTSTTISEDTFNDNNNKRDLSYTNGTADGTLHHNVTISDSLTVLGKNLGKTINISSANRSIEIAKKTVDGVDTGVVVDLVWNTTMEQ